MQNPDAARTLFQLRKELQDVSSALRRPLHTRVCTPELSEEDAKQATIEAGLAREEAAQALDDLLAKYLPEEALHKDLSGRSPHFGTGCSCGAPRCSRSSGSLVDVDRAAACRSCRNGLVAEKEEVGDTNLFRIFAKQRRAEGERVEPVPVARVAAKKVRPVVVEEPLPPAHHSWAGSVGQSIGDFFYALSSRGCGPCQCLALLLLAGAVLGILLLFNLGEVRATVLAVVRYKELHVKQVHTEGEVQMHSDDVHYALHVDAEKLREDNKHAERMALIQLADNAMRRFIDANTHRSHRWGVRPFDLGTEKSETSRTLFSEDDLLAFRNEILGFVMHSLDGAIEGGKAGPELLEHIERQALEDGRREESEREERDDSGHEQRSSGRGQGRRRRENRHDEYGYDGDDACTNGETCPVPAPGGEVRREDSFDTL